MSLVVEWHTTIKNFNNSSKYGAIAELKRHSSQYLLLPSLALSAVEADSAAFDSAQATEYGFIEVLIDG
jgi:hypothetical protein